MQQATWICSAVLANALNLRFLNVTSCENYSAIRFEEEDQRKYGACLLQCQWPRIQLKWGFYSLSNEGG